MRNKNKKSKSNNKITDQVYQEAIKVLQNCVHERGIKASARVRGYPQVWARDSMITLLGASLVQDRIINRALKSSFDTLRKKQTSLGCIPNNVDVRTLGANFQAYTDGGLWFVIGKAVLFEQTRNLAFLKKNYSAIKKILRWYEYQDVDQSGLISMQEATDWEDLFAVRGKGLYVNTLYYWALIKGSKIAKILKDNKNKSLYAQKARNLRLHINKRFWFTKNKDICLIIEDSFGTEFDLRKMHDALGRKLILPQKNILNKSSYYLPYITFRDFGEWFDSFGNMLVILTGIADKKQTKAVLNFIKKHKVASPFPIKAIYPPIRPGEKDWRYYYKFDNLNLPHRYHNGGIWPFLGGFYVAVLVKAGEYRKAEEALLSLALLNKKGKDGQRQFNECFHGVSGKPIGMDEQAWSAGMYIYAYEAVLKKRPPFF